MREPLRMITATLMQDMVQISKKNAYLETHFVFLNFGKVFLGLSALRAPRWGHSLPYVIYCLIFYLICYCY